MQRSANPDSKDVAGVAAWADSEGPKEKRWAVCQGHHCSSPLSSDSPEAGRWREFGARAEKRFDQVTPALAGLQRRAKPATPDAAVLNPD